jgi:DNA-binding winged helix-turn-helix (wHTH) protein
MSIGESGQLPTTDSSISTIEYDGRRSSHRLTIDLREMRIGYDGQYKTLTRKEHELLMYLVQHEGQVCSREALLNHLYPNGIHPQPKILDVFMTKIRKRLDLRPHEFIQTVWGHGYCFDRTAKHTSTVRDDTPVSPDHLENRYGLPPPGRHTRWTPKKKEAVIQALRQELLDERTLNERYGLGTKEVSEWSRLYTANGLAGLKSTAQQK